MRTLPLAGRRGDGRFVIVDDEDFGWLSSERWLYRRETKKHDRVTAQCAIVIHTYLGQRLSRAILSHHGHTLAGFLARHRNGWTLDNRKENLTLVTRGDNGRSGSRRNVHCIGGQWRIVIGKTVHGSFPTKEAALLARDEIATSLGYATSTEHDRLLVPVLEALDGFVRDGILTFNPAATLLEDKYRLRDRNIPFIPHSQTQ